MQILYTRTKVPSASLNWGSLRLDPIIYFTEDNIIVTGGGGGGMMLSLSERMYLANMARNIQIT